MEANEATTHGPGPLGPFLREYGPAANISGRTS
jgi:hypothetical protein